MIKENHNGKKVCGCRAANQGMRVQANVQDTPQTSRDTHPHQGNRLAEGAVIVCFSTGFRLPAATSKPTANRMKALYTKKAQAEKGAWTT